MPQLDKFIFLSQFLWLVLLLGGGYLLLVKWVLPSILQTLKFRRLLLRDPLSSRSVDWSPVGFPPLQPVNPSFYSTPLPLDLLPLEEVGGLLPPFFHLSAARRWNLLLRLQLEGVDRLPVWVVGRVGLVVDQRRPVRSGRLVAGWSDPSPLLPMAGLRVVDRLTERTLPF